ncbi:MAG TPA: aminotransferase class V-fold PLP-dependent enzyme [Candidatus Limnocylindrales bacterium]
MVAPFMPEAEKVAAIRAAIPATGASIYLNTGTAGPLSVETVAAMREMEDWQLRVGRGDIEGYYAFEDRLAECRGVLAALVGGDLDGIGLVHGATEAMNHAVLGVDWRPGDRAITTNAEHQGLSGPLWTVGRRFGVEIDVVDVGFGGDAERIVETIAAAMTPRTRLIALSQVIWTTGAVLPIADIAGIARRHDAWFVVDAAQSVGAIPVAVDGLGADVVGFAGQKWLGGPVGTGGLWASPRARTDSLVSWSGYPTFASESLPLEAVAWPTGRRFEWSDVHRPSVVGLARAVGWLQMYVGLPWAYERAARLARSTAERLVAIDGVTVVTPIERMATLVSFRVAGWTSEEVRVALARRVFAITRTIPALDLVRLSIGYFNSEPELDKLIGAVAEIAAHLPATLPSRPELVVFADPG